MVIEEPGADVKVRWRPLFHHVLVRRLASFLARRFHGKTPQWFADAYERFEFANVFLVVPTFIALWLAPRHFYRRLPQIVDGKHAPYVTPIKYISYALVVTTPAVLWVYPMLPGSHGAHELLEENVPPTAMHWIASKEDWIVQALLLIFASAAPLWIAPLNAILDMMRSFMTAAHNAAAKSTWRIWPPTFDKWGGASKCRISDTAGVYLLRGAY